MFGMFSIPWPRPNPLLPDWKEQQAPGATHGRNKEPGKMPAKSQKPRPLGHPQNSPCAVPSVPISMPGPRKVLTLKPPLLFSYSRMEKADISLIIHYGVRRKYLCSSPQLIFLVSRLYKVRVVFTVSCAEATKRHYSSRPDFGSLNKAL